MFRRTSRRLQYNLHQKQNAAEEYDVVGPIEVHNARPARDSFREILGGTSTELPSKIQSDEAKSLSMDIIDCRCRLHHTANCR
jgi:hypothetical protein